jgi:hypothetical protein
MSAQKQIEKLRTIQESMHEIADKVVSLGDGSVMLNDVAEGKKQIADAINTKGGNSTPDESFQQLAEDIQTLPYSGISAEGIVQTGEFSFLGFLTTSINSDITEINDSKITTITKSCGFENNIALRIVVMNGLAIISGNSTFSGCTSLQNMQFPNLATISGNYTFADCNYLRNMQFPNLATISGNYTFSGCTSLQSVQLSNLAIISGNYTFSGCTSLQSVQLSNLAIISGNSTFSGCTSLQSVQLSNLATISGSTMFYGCTSLQSVQFGTLIQCVEHFGNSKGRLRNLIIGQNTNINLPFQYWTATDVIREGQGGIDELNSNLYNNLLTKLYDHSEDGETRTLRIGWLAKVSQENIDYANAKGWTLTT